LDASVVFRPRREIELDEHGAQMGVDGPLREDETGSDTGIGQPVGQEP
jgi:hypothetical protein